jgi:hypothetical protein
VAQDGVAAVVVEAFLAGVLAVVAAERSEELPKSPKLPKIAKIGKSETKILTKPTLAADVFN